MNQAREQNWVKDHYRMVDTNSSDPQLQKYQAQILLTTPPAPRPPCSVPSFVVISEPSQHRGTSLGPFVCRGRACSLCSFKFS
jgi:hypothetical protein